MNNDEHQKWLKARDLRIATDISELKGVVPESKDANLTLKVIGYGLPLPKCDGNDLECVKIINYVKQKDNLDVVNVFNMRFNSRPNIYFATSSSRHGQIGYRYLLLDVRNNKIHELFDDKINGSNYEVSKNNTVNPNIIITSSSTLHAYKRYLEYRNGKYVVTKHHYQRKVPCGRMYDINANREVYRAYVYSFSGEVDSNLRPKQKIGHAYGGSSILVKDESGQFYIILENGAALTVDKKSMNRSIKPSDFVKNMNRRIVYSNHYKVKSSENTTNSSRVIGEYEQHFEKFENMPRNKK